MSWFGGRERLEAKARDLEMRLDAKKQELRMTRESLDFAKDCNRALRAERERDEAVANAEKAEKAKSEYWSKLLDAQGEVRSLEREVERLNRRLTLKPKDYVVKAPGHDGSFTVVADDHFVVPGKDCGEDRPVLQLFLQGDLVAQVPHYERFEIDVPGGEG